MQGEKATTTNGIIYDIKSAIDKFTELDKVLISQVQEEQKEMRNLLQEQTKILTQIKSLLKDCIEKIEEPNTKLSVGLIWIALAQIVSAFLLIYQLFVHHN